MGRPTLAANQRGPPRAPWARPTPRFWAQPKPLLTNGRRIFPRRVRAACHPPVRQRKSNNHFLRAKNVEYLIVFASCGKDINCQVVAEFYSNVKSRKLPNCTAIPPRNPTHRLAKFLNRVHSILPATDNLTAFDYAPRVIVSANFPCSMLRLNQPRFKRDDFSEPQEKASIVPNMAPNTFLANDLGHTLLL